MSVVERLHEALYGPVREAEMKLAVQAREDKLLSGADFEFFVPVTALTTGRFDTITAHGWHEVAVRFDPELLSLPLERPSIDRPVRVAREGSEISVQAYRMLYYDTHREHCVNDGNYCGAPRFEREGSTIVSIGNISATWFDDESYIGDRFGYCVDLFSPVPGELYRMRSTRLNQHGPARVEGRLFTRVWTRDRGMFMARNSLEMILDRNMLYSIRPTDEFTRQFSWSEKAYVNYDKTPAWVVGLTPGEKDDFGEFLSCTGVTYFYKKEDDPDPRLFEFATQEYS